MRSQPDLAGRETHSHSEYAERQAALVRALVTRSEAPAGFDPARVHALADALLRKRRRAVARTWPALAHSLGPTFEPEFERYVRSCPVRRGTDPIADGFEFWDWLRPRRARLDDAVILELLAVRARFAIRDGLAARRHGVFVAARRLRRRSVAVVIRTPVVAARTITVAWWRASRG